MSKTLIYLSATFMILVLFLSMFFIGDNSTYKFGGPKNISVLPIIADKEGLFKDNIERVDISTGKLAVDALLSKSIDFAVIVETNLVFLDDVSDIVVIGIIMDKKDDSLVYLPDFNIYNDKIMTTFGTSAHAYSAFYLDSLGISLEEKFVNMVPPSIESSLKNADYLAGSLWQPFRNNVLSSNSKFSEINEDVYTSYVLLAVRKDFYENKRNVVDRFLDSLNDANKFYNQNKDLVVEHMAFELSIPKENMKNFWVEYNVDLYSKDITSLLEKEALLLRNKSLKFENYFDFSYFR